MDYRQALERSMLAEMESLQSQIQQAKHATEINHLTAENLKREVSMHNTIFFADNDTLCLFPK